MPFHSPAFLLLCLVAFGLYYRSGERWQHGVLLVSSLAFYYYAGLIDTAILLGTVGINHLAARAVQHQTLSGRRALALVIAANLGVLAYFKYRRMVLEGANAVLGTHFSLPELVIPLGISFYIFQLIAYQVDLHRRELPREKSFWRMLLYILFFPHHQAGPIMRPAKFLPQFYGAKPFDPVMVGTGALWILWGLVKKVCADYLALGVDARFADPAGIASAAEAWSVALRYALQIYGDFSGYSDIAVGLGMLFGYRLDRNFDQPYLATDPAAFWRRWHITLSAWLRDYLYIPLGGNRVGPARTYLNLMLTMLLGGLWHGASVMFILWGFLHGALLVLHRRLPGLFAIRPIGWLLTFGFTVVAWVPFRASSWAANVRILGAMLGLHGLGSPRSWLKVIGLVAVVLVTQWAEDRLLHTEAQRARAMERWLRIPAALRGALLALLVIGILLMLTDQTTYIYFRF